jgi:hypothetical protein
MRKKISFVDVVFNEEEKIPGLSQQKKAQMMRKSSVISLNKSVVSCHSKNVVDCTSLASYRKTSGLTLTVLCTKEVQEQEIDIMHVPESYFTLMT